MYFDLSRPSIMIVIFSSKEKRLRYIAFIFISKPYAFKLFLWEISPFTSHVGSKIKLHALKGTTGVASNITRYLNDKLTM